MPHPLQTLRSYLQSHASGTWLHPRLLSPELCHSCYYPHQQKLLPFKLLPFFPLDLVLKSVFIVFIWLVKAKSSRTLWGFPDASMVKNLPANAGDCLPMQEARVWSLGREDALEEGVATHSSVLAWRIPRTEEAGRLQSIGSHRVRHNWSNLAHAQLSLG